MPDRLDPGDRRLLEHDLGHEDAPGRRTGGAPGQVPAGDGVPVGEALVQQRRRNAGAGQGGSAVTAAPRSDVALEDARLGQAGQALADGAGPALADAVDGHQVVEVGGQQLLEAVEVVDQAVDDGAGQPGDLGQQPVAAGADGRVEGVADDRRSRGPWRRRRGRAARWRRAHQVRRAPPRRCGRCVPPRGSRG